MWKIFNKIFRMSEIRKIHASFLPIFFCLYSILFQENCFISDNTSVPLITLKNKSERIFKFGLQLESQSKKRIQTKIDDSFYCVQWISSCSFRRLIAYKTGHCRRKRPEEMSSKPVSFVVSHEFNLMDMPPELR